MACFWTDLVGVRENCSGGGPTPEGNLISFVSTEGPGFDFGTIQVEFFYDGAASEQLCTEEIYLAFVNANINDDPVVITGIVSTDDISGGGGSEGCGDFIADFDEVSLEMGFLESGAAMYYRWINDGTYPYGSDWMIRVDIAGVIYYGSVHIGY